MNIQRWGKILPPLFLTGSLILGAGCSKLTIPRMTHDDQPLPQAPVAVNLFLEEPVRTATIDYSACDELWQGHLGHAIATAFLDVGRKAFGEIHLIQTDGQQGSSSPQPANLTVQLRLIKNTFEAGSQFGSENHGYAAGLHIQLMAIFLDASGTAIGQTPLVYNKAVNVWTPVIDSTGTCNTAQLDFVVEEAAEDLARQMVTVVSRVSSPPPGSSGPRGYSQQAGGPIPTPASSLSSLTIQATLIDGNDNVILESGEKVGVRIDATNNGASPIASARVNLSGTPALIDAFANTLTAPIDMGPLQPGAKKSTLLWGKMPPSLEAQRGELVVTVISGSTSTSQTLISAIRPLLGRNSFSKQKSPPPSTWNRNSGFPAQSTQADINRYGILIGVDRYLPTWPGIAPRPLTGVIQAASTLKRSGGIPGKQILVLRGEQATKTNMERAIIQWLPPRINQDSLVFLYISGNAVTNTQTGEVFLVPFTETPSSPEDRFFSLHALQGSLKRTKAKMILLFVDTPIISPSHNGNPAQGNTSEPDWQGMIEKPSTKQSIPMIQIVRKNASRSQLPHPMDGLNGSADLNRDGLVTIGEFLDFVGPTAKIYPSLSRKSPVREISLTGKL